MPLRDHFRPPIYPRHSWEGFHALWPGMIVQQLFTTLPEGHMAEPRVQLGNYFEIDIGEFETDDDSRPLLIGPDDTWGVANLPWAAPTTTFDTDLGEQYGYEVLIYDQTHGRRLVAAVEFVSPSNKDRPEHRRLFVAKCAALLQQKVCVSIVDVVTIRLANLYAELLELIERSDPDFGAVPPATYDVTCRAWTPAQKPRLDIWAYPLEIGHQLPTLPLWLAEDVAVALDLEASYQETCRVLRIA